MNGICKLTVFAAAICGAAFGAASDVDVKSFGLVDETTFDDVRSWRLTDAGLNLVASDGRLAWQMRPQGRVRKGRFSLRHSPNAKGTFCGRPLSPTGLTEIEVGEFDCKTLVLDAAAPITLTELSFDSEKAAREFSR